MLILLLCILIYISYKLNVKSYILFVILALLLVLNEIYNYNDISKDTFQNMPFSDSPNPTATPYVSLKEKKFNENFKFNEIDPYLYSRDEFNLYKIPYNNEHSEKAISCEAQKYLKQYLRQDNKLNKQSDYVNDLFNYYKQSTDSFNVNPNKFDPEKSVGLKDVLKNLNVFNPIRNSKINNIKCPTLCHMKTDEFDCSTSAYYDYMKNSNDIKYEKLNKAIDKCSRYANKFSCHQDEDKNCFWDDSYERCVYAKKGCMYVKDSSEDFPKCHTKCEFITTDKFKNNINFDQDKKNLNKYAETECNNQKYLDTNGNLKKLCSWVKKGDGSGKGNCLTCHCSLYENEVACQTDNNCRLTEDGKCENIVNLKDKCVS